MSYGYYIQAFVSGGFISGGASPSWQPGHLLVTKVVLFPSPLFSSLPSLLSFHFSSLSLPSLRSMAREIQLGSLGSDVRFPGGSGAGGAPAEIDFGAFYP